MYHPTAQVSLGESVLIASSEEASGAAPEEIRMEGPLDCTACVARNPEPEARHVMRQTAERERGTCPIRQP